MADRPGKKRAVLEALDGDDGDASPDAKRSRVQEGVKQAVAALETNPAVNTLALQLVPPAVAALAPQAAGAAAAGAAAAPAAPEPGPGFLTRATDTIYRYRGTVATAVITAAGVGLAASGTDFGALDAALAQGVSIVSAGTATLIQGLFESLDPVAAITAVGGAVANSATAGALVENVGNLQTAAVAGAGYYALTQAADAAGVPLGPTAAVDATVAAASGTRTLASGALRGFTAFSRGTGTLLRQGFIGLGGGLRSILTSAVARASGSGAGSAADGAGAGAGAPPPVGIPSDIEVIIADMEARCNYSATVSKILIDALGKFEDSLNKIYTEPAPSHADAVETSLNDIITKTEAEIDKSGGAENLRKIYKESVILFLRKAAAVLVKRAQLNAGITPSESLAAAPTPFNSPAGVGSPSTEDNEKDYRSLKLRGVIVDSDKDGGFERSVEIFLRRPHPDEEGGGGAAAAGAAATTLKFGGCPTCGGPSYGGSSGTRRRKHNKKKAAASKKSRKNMRKSYRRGHKKRSRSRAPTKSRSPSEAIYASPPVPEATTSPHMESSGPPVRS